MKTALLAGISTLGLLAVGAPARADGFTVVLSDDFTKDTKLNANLWPVRWGNGDDFVFGSNGLTIQSKASEGWAATGFMQKDGGAKDGQGYGVYAVTAIAHANQGVGMCIVMWPSDNNWPGAELDLMEDWGNTNRQSGFSTIHWWKAGGNHNGQDPHSFAVDMTKPHTYAMDWEPGTLTFYIDGQKIYEVTGAPEVPKDAADGGINETIGAEVTAAGTGSQPGSVVQLTIQRIVVATSGGSTPLADLLNPTGAAPSAVASVVDPVTPSTASTAPTVTPVDATGSGGSAANGSSGSSTGGSTGANGSTGTSTAGSTGAGGTAGSGGTGTSTSGSGGTASGGTASGGTGGSTGGSTDGSGSASNGGGGSSTGTAGGGSGSGGSSDITYSSDLGITDPNLPSFYPADIVEVPITPADQLATVAATYATIKVDGADTHFEVAGDINVVELLAGGDVFTEMPGFTDNTYVIYPPAAGATAAPDVYLGDMSKTRANFDVVPIMSTTGWSGTPDTLSQYLTVTAAGEGGWEVAINGQPVLLAPNANVTQAEFLQNLLLN